MTEQKPHKWHDLIVAWAGGTRVRPCTAKPESQSFILLSKRNGSNYL